MKSLKAQLQGLKTSLGKASSGWTWFFDEKTGFLTAKRGEEICPVFQAHPNVSDSNGYPIPTCQKDAVLIAEALNKLPKLIDALDRVLALAEELDGMAGKRQQAAHRARLEQRYDLSEAHRQSMNRVKTIKQAFLQEIQEAFKDHPEPAASLSDYQGNINVGLTQESDYSSNRDKLLDK